MQTHHLPFSAERVRGGPPGHGPARAAGPATCCPSLHICERAPEAPGGQWPGRTWPRARPSTGLIISWGAGCRALMPLGSWCRIAGRASALPEQNPPSWHWLALTDCVRWAPVRLRKHGPERPPNPEKWHRHGRIPWRRKRRTRTPKQGPRTLGAYKWPSPLHSSHLGPGGRPGQAPCPFPGGPEEQGRELALSLPLSPPQRASWVARRTGWPPPQRGGRGRPSRCGPDRRAAPGGRGSGVTERWPWLSPSNLPTCPSGTLAPLGQGWGPAAGAGHRGQRCAGPRFRSWLCRLLAVTRQHSNS